ncbi:hypothetical protein Tco_0390165 [Tanacetum coccineum]
MASIFYTSPAEIERIEFCQKQVKPILNELQVYLDAFQDLFHRDIKEMKDAFEQNDVYLDEIENQNDLLKDQLLEASLTEDIKNLVITSCVEIRNKDLHDEIERISKESKDVSNESKTVDTACNDAFEVKQELSKRIVELEKDLSKSEAKGIAFEIDFQHKVTRNNSFLKTVQKENENFMASLQLENAHLKQTYKDLFESVQRSKVEIKQCDEVKVKDDFDEIETKNIELEYRVASLIKENEHLKLTYKNLFDSIKKSRLDISELNKGSGENVCDNAKYELQTKIVELERTTKFEAYFEKLEKTKVVLERQLARKVDDSKAENVRWQTRENEQLEISEKATKKSKCGLCIKGVLCREFWDKAHLKQTYKDLFESVQRSKVETHQCDEAKVKDDFDEIETRNIELEYRVASLIKENEHLKLTYKNLFDSIKKSRVQTKTSNVTQDEAENLKSQLFEFAETKFKNILEKIEFFKKKQLDISELNMESGENVCDNAKCEFLTKFVELEKVLTQQTKYFNDVKLELSNRTAKFEEYFEKLEKTKVVLERQLARKVNDSKAEKDQFLKEINHSRTQLENLKGKSVQTKFDKHSILGKPPADKLLINSQISKSWFTPKVDVQKSLSKPVTT